MDIKNKIIKLLGGYTKSEYNRLEKKYQGLLDSKTDFTCTKIVNEYVRRTLKDLCSYARTVLYGKPMNIWCEKMYNVIHNNYLRMEVRYFNTNSSIPYTIDTTIDNKDEFLKVLQSGNEDEQISYIMNNINI